jgi:pyruvate ferredoxin oxidoreductase alpha subunit
VSFIGGLGGRDIRSAEFFEMVAVTRRAADQGRAPEPRLLYTEQELREIRKLQGIALAERHETSPSQAGKEAS